MRIGIITLYLHTNYGGLLQAYALQTVLERMGHEVWVIDKVKRKHLPLWKAPFSLTKRAIRKYVLRKQTRLLSERYYNRTFPIISQNTRAFMDTYIHRREIRDYGDIEEYEFDCLVVGSDQVWRPTYMRPIQNAYLGFARRWNIKRVVYAASFGHDCWLYNRCQTRECANLIKLFDAVSVREESGVRLCKEYLGVNAQWVLDPTMLLSATDFYEIIARKNMKYASHAFIFTYILDQTEETDQFLTEVSRYTQLPLVQSNSQVENKFAPVCQRIQPPVEEWLTNIQNAELILTDSFHACVFSILYNKNFLVYENRYRGNARIQSLLEMLGLENRWVKNASNIEKVMLPIDYSAVKLKLEKLKGESWDYLLNTIGKGNSSAKK